MYVVLLVPRFLFLMNFGSESGCLGLENQEFGKGGVAKITFRIECPELIDKAMN